MGIDIYNIKVFHTDLSKAAYITYKVYMFIFFSFVHLFPWNRTHDLQIASNKLFCLSYRNAVAVSEITLYSLLHYSLHYKYSPLNEWMTTSEWILTKKSAESVV